MQQQGAATYAGFKTITPSDTTLVNCRAISPDATKTGVVIKAPHVGTILPIELNGGRVMAANTATLLVALS